MTAREVAWGHSKNLQGNFHFFAKIFANIKNTKDLGVYMAKQDEQKEKLNQFSKQQVEKKYKELTAKFKELDAEDAKMKIFDDLFWATAVIVCDLERIRLIPSILINEKYPSIIKQSDAGKVRVKLVAQLRDNLSKLYRDIIGTLPENFDDDLEDYE